MKEKLLDLINKTEEIERLFHSSTGSPSLYVICDVQEFQIWIRALTCVLQEIYDRTHDKFIWNSINDLSDIHFNGWKDRNSFDRVKGDLLAIKDRIDVYYSQKRQPTQKQPQNTNDSAKIEVTMKKQPKIFISHKQKDLPHVQKIVHLIEHIGVSPKDIFCSSMPGYGVPNGKDIFEFLREQFMKYNLYVVFVHSSNFYKSPVGLNEMGAAWVLKNEHISFLLPNFDFKDMTGVINSREAAIKLDADIYEVKDRLNQFRDKLTTVFGLPRVDGIIWEKTRDEFIEGIKSDSTREQSSNNRKSTKELSDCAEELLLNASKTDLSRLCVSATLSGTTIYTAPRCYSSSTDREFYRWEAALQELINAGYMTKYGKNACLLKLTEKGYTYLENKK